MKKIFIAFFIIITSTTASFALTSNDKDIYVRKDVFDVHMQNINSNLEKILNEIQSQRNDINELAKAIAVLSERTDRNFDTLSTRIDGINTSLSARIDGVNARVDDLRNGMYLWLVVIGILVSLVGVLIAWPRVKHFLQYKEGNNRNRRDIITIEEIERLIDAKLEKRNALSN